MRGRDAEDLLQLEGRLVFKGDGEVPYLQQSGAAPLMVRGTDSAQPKLARAVHVNVYRLWVPEELAAYREVMRAIGDGVVKMSAEDREFVADKASWVIFLRWFIPYMRAPVQEVKGHATFR